MSSDGTPTIDLDAQATLANWRACGAHRLDPVRFQFLDAMARRAAALEGPARPLLDAKLRRLILAYQERLDADTATRPAVHDDAGNDADHESIGASGGTPCAPPAPEDGVTGTLAGLLDYLANPAAPGGDDAWTRDALGLRAAYPDVQMLEYFRAVWSRVSADRQVRQSQEQVHKNAGPLNSNQLVHRALSLMREVSPGYLQHFLAYADALIWMEQMQAATAPPPKESSRAGAAKGGSAKGGTSKNAAAKGATAKRRTAKRGTAKGAAATETGASIAPPDAAHDEPA